MKYQELPEPMKDDPLKILLILMGYSMRRHYHIIKILFAVAAIYIGTFNILGMVDVILTEEFKTAFKYVPVLVVEFAAGTSGMMWVFNHNQWFFALHDDLGRYFWCINSAGKKIKAKILRERRSAVILYLAVMLQVLTTYVSFLYFVGDEETIYCTLRFYKKFFGRWSMILLLIHLTSTFITCESIVFMPVTCIYIIYQTKFQLYLLNGYMERALTKPIRNQTFTEEVKYQDMIYRNISICAQHYANIRRITNTFFKMVDISALVVSANGLVSIVLGIYFVLQGVSPSSNFKFIVYLGTGASVLISACICGQMIIDESESFYVAMTNCPWIYWNKKNRRAFLLLLTFVQIPMHIKCFGFMVINYAYLLYFFKMVYSLVALCLKFK